MEPLTFVVAPGVEPAPGCREALEAAAAEAPDGVLFAAVVEGDEAWPRILDKEDAIDACRHGLVALRAVMPGAVLTTRPVADFAATAALLAEGKGFLVPAARATRRGGGARLGRRARLRILRAPHFSREERLWQLFRMLSRAE
ncbi:MAG TPA: hypothetical protein VF587_09535 [Solirubrobacteraceae bacterium]